jgi:hypothetical protein
MRFELVQHLHGPVEAIEEALVDPRFLARLGELPKLGRPQLLEQRDMGDRFVQRVRYDFEGDLSATVKAVIDPSKLTWVEQSTQDRVTHTSDIEIVPDYYTSMFTCRGTTRLTPNPATGVTDRITTGEVAVRVPLVGRKAEAAIISGLHEHAELEAEALDGWLRGAQTRTT